MCVCVGGGGGAGQVGRSIQLARAGTTMPLDRVICVGHKHPSTTPSVDVVVAGTGWLSCMHAVPGHQPSCLWLRKLPVTAPTTSPSTTCTCTLVWGVPRCVCPGLFRWNQARSLCRCPHVTKCVVVELFSTSQQPYLVAWWWPAQVGTPGHAGTSLCRVVNGPYLRQQVPSHLPTTTQLHVSVRGLSNMGLGSQHVLATATSLHRAAVCFQVH
jgi:hypothetical protein